MCLISYSEYQYEPKRDYYFFLYHFNVCDRAENFITLIDFGE